MEALVSSTKKTDRDDTHHSSKPHISDMLHVSLSVY